VTELRGSVAVGQYVLTVGSPAGTILALAPQSESASSTAVFKALTEPAPVAVERLEELVEGSETITGRTERAVELFTEVATGRILDRDFIVREVDSLLDLLQRLDRAGRHEDALRLARALSGLLALLLRWVALVESLRIALRAARALGAGIDEAWALQELGTLAAAAGDAAAATGQLEDALRLRERIGDRAGADTTASNLDVIRTALASGAGGGGGGGRRWLLVAAGAGTLVLLAVGGLALALSGDDDDASTTLSTTTAPTTTTSQTTEPTTTSPVTTAPDTTTAATTTTIPLPGPAAIVKGPDELTNLADASFEFSSGGATGFECSLDGEGFSECTSPTTYQGLSDGAHSFEARGVNAAGAGESARATWTVDTVPPTTTVDEVSEGEGGTWTFTFSADETATFECRVDDATFVACESGYTWVDPVQGGEHVFEAQATDEAGNVGEPSSETFGNPVVE
jgi:hypothetical protein